jgi:drug/metabolite transporter (DMT)-like permease
MDALLFLMVVLWGGNYSLIKATLAELPPRPFNALRMTFASAAFLVMLAWMWGRSRGRSIPDAGPQNGPLADRLLGVTRPTPGDWLRIVGTGLVGHTLYQLAFIEGLSRTTASNTALLIGASPIVVSLLTAVVGHERLSRPHWIGLSLSFCGVYFVVGRPAALGSHSLSGDLIMLGAVSCWAVYAVASRVLLARHSPLFVTGWTMITGTVAFVVVAWGDVARVDWAALPAGAWGATLVSALTALNLAYLIYYVSVTRIGVARTSVWTNMTPLVGMLIAWTSLGERLAASQVAGAALILAGVAVTRVAARRERSAPVPPAE